MRQRPGTAKGIVFITLEDEFGVANLVVYPNIGDRDWAAMIGARLMLAEGRVQRETEHAEVPVIHLICRKLTDGGDLLQRLRMSGDDVAGRAAMLAGADEKRRPDPGSTRATAGLPASWDFR